MGVLKNEVPRWIALAVWLSIQVGLFGYYFWFYSTDSRFVYARIILRTGLAFARAAASCLNFNCMLILLPVCRNLVSITRRILCKCCLRSLRRLLDKNITFHKLIAYAICFWTAVHAIAHCYNLESFVTAKSDDPSSASKVNAYKLSSLGSESCPQEPDNDAWVNPVCGLESTTILEAFVLFPAISGVIITLCLMVIVFSATEFIRRSYFEIFWFTHHLFVVFFAFLVVHGFRGVVRAQDSSHNTTYCESVDFVEWGKKDSPCPLPKFSSNTPASWYWVIVPIILYLLERLIRVYRSFQRVVVIQVCILFYGTSLTFLLVYILHTCSKR